MVSRGDDAPSFDLPAVVDGEITNVDLDEYLGGDIVVLAFYPGDFNPACTDETADLDDLNLFTMQKDVSIFAISGDSVYSHRAFAESYDLQIPLLSDVHGDVAALYDVSVDDPDAGYGTGRAIVIINLSGNVTDTWETDDPREVPDISTIRSRLSDVGGDRAARARYRVGHAHYSEGRRAFTSAMHELEDSEWMMAEQDFRTANSEFAEAQDIFNSAVRFADDETELSYYERAENKSEALWRASEWLAEAANAFASGEGAEGERLRRDAESPLEDARAIHEPPDPDDFPPEQPSPEPEQSDERAPDQTVLQSGDDSQEDISLDVDIDVDDATETPNERENEKIREQLQDVEDQKEREIGIEAGGQRHQSEDEGEGEERHGDEPRERRGDTRGRTRRDNGRAQSPDRESPTGIRRSDRRR